MKQIKMYWWIFLVFSFMVFLVGVVIGFLVIPQPQKPALQAAAEPVAVKGEVVTVPAETFEPVGAAGDIKPPRLIKQVDPVYPEIARQARVQGVVILEATTDVYGRVQNVKVLRSVPLLDQAAIDALRQWVYEPMVIKDKPHGVTFTVTVRFKLKDENSETVKKDKA